MSDVFSHQVTSITAALRKLRALDSSSGVAASSILDVMKPSGVFSTVEDLRQVLMSVVGVSLPGGFFIKHDRKNDRFKLASSVLRGSAMIYAAASASASASSASQPHARALQPPAQEQHEGGRKADDEQEGDQEVADSERTQGQELVMDEVSQRTRSRKRAKPTEDDLTEDVENMDPDCAVSSGSSSSTSKDSSTRQKRGELRKSLTEANHVSPPRAAALSHHPHTLTQQPQQSVETEEKNQDSGELLRQNVVPKTALLRKFRSPRRIAQPAQAAPSVSSAISRKQASAPSSLVPEEPLSLLSPWPTLSSGTGPSSSSSSSSSPADSVDGADVSKSKASSSHATSSASSSGSGTTQQGLASVVRLRVVRTTSSSSQSLADTSKPTLEVDKSLAPSVSTRSSQGRVGGASLAEKSYLPPTPQNDRQAAVSKDVCPPSPSNAELTRSKTTDHVKDAETSAAVSTPAAGNASKLPFRVPTRTDLETIGRNVMVSNGYTNPGKTIRRKALLDEIGSALAARGFEVQNRRIGMLISQMNGNSVPDPVWYCSDSSSGSESVASPAHSSSCTSLDGSVEPHPGKDGKTLTAVDDRPLNTTKHLSNKMWISPSQALDDKLYSVLRSLDAVNDETAVSVETIFNALTSKSTVPKSLSSVERIETYLATRCMSFDDSAFRFHAFFRTPKYTDNEASAAASCRLTLFYISPQKPTPPESVKRMQDVANSATSADVVNAQRIGSVSLDDTLRQLPFSSRTEWIEYQTSLRKVFDQTMKKVSHALVSFSLQNRVDVDVTEATHCDGLVNLVVSALESQGFTAALQDVGNRRMLQIS
eukprot:ANDGO_01671.mRNA.1 hypothetical protein